MCHIDDRIIPREDFNRKVPRVSDYMAAWIVISVTLFSFWYVVLQVLFDMPGWPS